MMRARYEPLGAKIQIVESPDKLLLSMTRWMAGEITAVCAREELKVKKSTFYRLLKRVKI